MEGLPGFIMAGFALAGSPGPATLSLAATGAAFGGRRGLDYLTGIVTGMVVVMAITASGVSGMLLALPGALPIVVTLAALYFVYLALRIATAPPLAADAGERRTPSFLGGLFLSLVNPKGYAVMAALFSGFVLIPERVGLDVLLKMTVLVAIMIIVDLAWLLAGAALTRLFREPATNRAINLMLAALLLLSVALALSL